MSYSSPSPSINDQETKENFATFLSRYDDVSSGTVSDGNSNNKYQDLTPLPFEDDQQKVILLNITHRQQRPKSKIPGFRICGAFRNIDKLKKHVESVDGVKGYGGANLLKADAHKKFLICSSFEKQQNSTYVLNKIKDVTDKYVEILKAHDQEFKNNKEEQKMGQTGLSQHEKIKKLESQKELDQQFDDELKKELHKESNTETENKPKNVETGEVSRNAEIRKQMVAVISIIEDTTPAVLEGLEDPEPIVIVWGCFEDDHQAKHYIYNTASKHVTDVMLDIVNMYEWVYPTQIEEKLEEITEEFRNPTLDQVMRTRKQQKSKVDSYEDWLKKENREPSVLEILSDKKTQESTEMETRVKIMNENVMTLSIMKDDEKSPAADNVNNAVRLASKVANKGHFEEVKPVKYVPLSLINERQKESALHETVSAMEEVKEDPFANSTAINSDVDPDNVDPNNVDPNNLSPYPLVNGDKSGVLLPTRPTFHPNPESEPISNVLGLIDTTGTKNLVNLIGEKPVKRRGRPAKNAANTRKISLTKKS